MKRKRIIGMIVLLMCVLTLSASASGVFDGYVYNTDQKSVAAPDAVTLCYVRTGEEMGTTALDGASDLCIGPDGRLYIADTNHDRILILNTEQRVERVLTSYTDAAGVAHTLSAPQGVYVHTDGRLYIADTGHQQIVMLDAAGGFLRAFGAPHSPVLTDNFVYKPTKLAVDTADRMFVVSAGCNLGLLQLDKDGQFVQCLGAPKVTYTVSEYIWRLFSTREQRDRSASFVPTEYNNVTADEENFLFVTSSAYNMWEYMNGTISPLRRLNALGNDILRANGNTRPFGDTAVITVGNFRGPSTLVDVTTMGHGMYAVLDANRSRVFVYDGDGAMLFMFGGTGDFKGGFRTPSALVYDDGTFYILDSSKQTLTAYTVNRYGSQLIDATVSHDMSRYDDEQRAWKEIADENINQSLALVGVGKAAYRQKDYPEAMRLFRLADDKTEYSKAFQKQRSIVIREQFGGMMAGLLAIIALALVLRAVLKRHPLPVADRFSYRGRLGYARTFIFHPLDAGWDLKREKRGGMAAALTILGLCCAAMAVYDCFSGYIFCAVSEENRNIFLEIGKVLVPFFLFCICNWCVTSLIGGEGSFRDIVIAAAYSLTPIVILLPIATVLSHFLTLEEKDFYIVFVTIAFLWMAVLLVCSNKQAHNYSMSQTIGILLLTLLVMAIVVFLCVLAFVLIQQFVTFASDVANELYLR